MNFKEWFYRHEQHPHNNPKIMANLGWDACKIQVLKIIQNTKISKVPGIEGLGGYHWEDMDAETFKQELIKEINKL